jgi:hypothetical protein
MARITCAHCKQTHATVAEVRECAYEQYEGEAQARAEHEAEMAIERYFEDRGWYEAALQEEMEARMGVIGFAEAMALAEGR